MPRRRHYDNLPWCIVPVKPGVVSSFRRWNVVLIFILAFFVIGAFVMTMTPEPGHAAAAAHKVALKIDKDPAMGVQAQDLTPAVAQELGISRNTRGVVITSVDPASAAAAADLERGDVIQEVNRKPVHNVREYTQAVAEAHGQSILLLVSRGDTTHFVAVQPQ